MTTTSTPNPLREMWVPQLLMGIVALVLGVLLLVWPGVSILAASVLLGVYLVASGIAQVILAFGLELSGGYRVLWFISRRAVADLGCPGLPPLRPRVCGSAAGHLDRRRVHLPGGGRNDDRDQQQGAARTGRRSIFFGVTSVIAGLVVMVWPFDSIVMLALYTGIMLVVIGIAQVVSSIGTRNDLRTAEKRLSQVIPGATNRAA